MQRVKISRGFPLISFPSEESELSLSESFSSDSEEDSQEADSSE